MAKIDTYHPDYLPAKRVRQALSMEGFKPVRGNVKASEYRILGCGYNDHAHYYVKTEDSADHVPAVLVIYPYRLDELQNVFDKVPDAALCKSELSTSFIRFPRYKSKTTLIGYSVVFKKHRAVKDFLDALRTALKSGVVTEQIEPTLIENQTFM